MKQLPGGVEDSLKTPKMILCYFQLSQITNPDSWAGVQSKPATAMVSKYDPALCPGSENAANTTSEYMLYQAWHPTGTWPYTGGELDIKVYGWVYENDPRLSSSTPMVSYELDFKPGSSLIVKYHQTVDENVDGGMNMKADACGRIKGTLKSDGSGYSGVEFYSTFNMNMKTEQFDADMKDALSTSSLTPFFLLTLFGPEGNSSLCIEHQWWRHRQRRDD